MGVSIMQILLKFLALIFVVLCLAGCLAIDTKCCKHISTQTISKKLYVERYQTFCAGVFGNLTECYITDSIFFRHKIGEYDEHERFRVEFDGNRVAAYNFDVYNISDTIEKKILSNTDLLNYHHSEINALTTSPVFGKNTIRCDKKLGEVSSYKTEEGNYITQIQYHCKDDFSNAVFYTDSSNFCVLLGIYESGSLENHYSVRKVNQSFEFYNITYRSETQILKTQIYLLSDLKKKRLVSVCENKS